jgi:hypothetical protein
MGRRKERRTDEHLRRAGAFAAAELRRLEVGRLAVVLQQPFDLFRLHGDEVGEQFVEVFVPLAMDPREKALVAGTLDSNVATSRSTAAIARSTGIDGPLRARRPPAMPSPRDRTDSAGRSLPCRRRPSP